MNITNEIESGAERMAELPRRSKDMTKDTINDERIVIMGGVPLQGEVEVSGSKNSSLAILAAALLASRGQ